MAKHDSDQQTSVNVALLKALSETPGVAGREERVRALVIEQLKPLVDELTVDPLGNVIALKKGSSDGRVMLAAGSAARWVRSARAGGAARAGAYARGRFAAWRLHAAEQADSSAGRQARG